MKKLLAFALAAIIAVCASAADRISYNANELPQAARTALTRHFGKAKINFIKIDDKFLGSTEYEVVLTNGTEVGLNSKGEIVEVEAGRNGVPASLLLKPIREYLLKNYKGRKVVELNIKKDKYEVELSSGEELEFGRDGRFLRIDH